MDYTNSLWGHGASLLAALTLTYLPCHPIATFLRRGWEIKRADIVGSFNNQAKKLYLKTFFNSDTTNADKDFDALYDHRYGRYRLILPIILFVAVCLPLMLLISETAVSRLMLSSAAAPATLSTIMNAGLPFVLLPGIALAAVVGAYLWIVADLITRSGRYDLSPSDVLRATLRLALAAPLGYAVSSIANASVGPFIAFAIGAFPLDTIGVLLRRLANKQLNLDIGVDSRPDQIIKLDSIDPSTADRLQDFGITTIAQLAYCDPVQLCMRTGLLFDFIVDIVSQALAWIYFQEKMNDLRYGGLRGALEIRNLVEERKNPDPKTAAAAEAAFQSAATVAKMDPAAFENACAEIADDPFTVFLSEMW
jgi:hypothetical protein